MHPWLRARLESILDNLIFAGVVAVALAVWNAVRSLPLPITIGVSGGIFILILVILRLIIYSLKQNKFPRKKRGITILIIGIILIIGGIMGVFMVVDALNTPIVSTPKTASTPTISVDTTRTTPPFKIPTFEDATKIVPTQDVYVRVGLLTFQYKWSDLKDGVRPPIGLDDSIPFKVHSFGNKPYVDVSVYGGTGVSPITITDNLLTVTPKNWDENEDDYAFEVVNDKKDPIFQLIYESQFSIVIYGVFPMPKGSWVAFDGQTGLVWGNSPFATYHIEPIFKYPSKDYQGIRTK